jgi:hypothetical protein
MSRSTLTRLEKLEAASADERSGPWRRIIAYSHEEAEAKQIALIASGDASESDNFIYRIITGVPRSDRSIIR